MVLDLFQCFCYLFLKGFVHSCTKLQAYFERNAITSDKLNLQFTKFSRCLVKILYISCFLCSSIRGLKSLHYFCFICHKYLSYASRKDNIYLQWSCFFPHVSKPLRHWRVYPYPNQLYFVEILFHWQRDRLSFPQHCSPLQADD